MARYLGYPFAVDPLRLAGALEYSTVRSRPYGPDQKTTLHTEPGNADPGLIPQTTGNWLHSPSQHEGALTSVGRDLLFERVWFTPALVEAGFITGALLYDISIWNAYENDSKNITSVSVVNEDGVSLPIPSLPHTIGAAHELILKLTIAADGSAVQNTTYTFVIGIESFTLLITGIRVVGLVPEPNWGPTIKINYSFQTAHYQTERFEEQRRPMLDVPYRSLMADYLPYGTEAHKFFYMLSYGHDKVFGVPVYNEMMRATSIPVAGTTITLSTPTANMYNLNNLCTHIVIVDHLNDKNEIHEVASIGANSIEIEQSISETFNLNTTLVYPIFFATIRSLRKQHATDDVEIIRLELQEYNSG